MNVPANTWSLGLQNAKIQFGDFMSLTGNFSVSSAPDGSTQYGATDVEIFFGDGPYRLDDGSVNPDAIGLLITNATVGAVKFSDGSFAIYTIGTASLVGVDGVTIHGTVTVKINQTGHAITSTILMPDNSSVVMPFTTSTRITEVDVSQLLLSAGGIVNISQGSTAPPAKFVMQPSGRVDVSIPSVTVSISIPIDGQLTEAFGISGDAQFSFGGGLGFQLQNLFVNGFEILGDSVTLTPTPPPPAPPTIELASPDDGQSHRRSRR